MEETEVITAYGHRLIRSTHKITFEVTKERHLTERGDCIIAVNADKAAIDLSQGFKEAARKPNAKIRMTIEAGEEKETVEAMGDPELSFSHPTDMVVRKSSYVCDRTVAVKADKAASDFSRRLVKKLQNPNQMVKITFTVRLPG